MRHLSGPCRVPVLVAISVRNSHFVRRTPQLSKPSIRVIHQFPDSQDSLVVEEAKGTHGLK